MKLLAAALLAAFASQAMASGVDYAEAWIACDEAAVGEGFAEAGAPDRSAARESVNRQLAGRWEGQELVTVTAPAGTGGVFCMTTTDYRVVQYKFDGRTVIERD